MTARQRPVAPKTPGADASAAAFEIELSCPQCGAPFVATDATLTETCAHCRSLLLVLAPDREEVFVEPPQVKDGKAVLESLLLGRHTRLRSGLVGGSIWWGRAVNEEMAARRRVEEVIDFLEIAHLRHTHVGSLPHGLRKRVELGRALAMDPTLLLLDEPVAGMTDEETERTAELFLSLEGKHSLVVVEHDMKFIGELTRNGANAHKKKVTVLHEGSVLAEGALADVQANERVVEVYLGR